MSAQTMADVWTSITHAQRERVYQATWGHLAPRRNKRYKGTVLFAHGEYGDLVPLRCDLDCDSPWFFEALQDFIGEQNTREGGIYRFTGYWCNYRFIGTVEEVKL